MGLDQLVQRPFPWWVAIEQVWTAAHIPAPHEERRIHQANQRAEGKGVHLGLSPPVQDRVDPIDGKPTMEYPYNPNGSNMAIAGICDPTGRIFGLMPHREAFWSPFNHPSWHRLKIDGKLPSEGPGIQISRNGIEYVREHLI